MEATPGRYRARPLPPARRVLISSAVMGTLLLVFTEAMLFAGLISAYLVIRMHAGVWPPPGQPRLPLMVTGLSTAILLASGVTMWLAWRAVRRDRGAQVQQWLGATFALGLTFLLIQGYEWARLLGFGLTTSSGVYGGLFYTLIGAHGVHIIGALATLWAVLKKARHGSYTAASHPGLSAMSLFWYFVVAVWPLLYWLVYLW